ncbi:hypothetical protein A5757_04625 [Mycobacterium sp. 852013-51886_SCH5428379]|uniref:hypothetical protein n=1 Tax=Mycobacterium sp. 852013-51886_SCH5428379 TaxID=1834111 RepID=UPI000800F502|nr:hypothetical protein [Mycobacterium sp. 852013-51886_SCH5428379]OBB62168.1 hypothetical protein A5757_04625 [Mycobacterium sp. 852013-51886_SCH5428379]
MSPVTAIAAAAVFVWLGMVLAISFLEAPLKFRAPGVTVPIGLGIGQLVFRALNIAEVVLAGIVVVAVAFSRPPVSVLVAVAVVVVMLIVQLLGVRPRLTRRSRAVLAGENAPRSRAHHAYVVLEVVKVIALVAAGVALLSS